MKCMPVKTAFAIRRIPEASNDRTQTKTRVTDAITRPDVSMARRSALFALALAFFALIVPWSASGVGPTGAVAVPMSRETEDSLPGIQDDPLVRQALKCNACHVVLEELLPTLRMERAKRRRPLSADEFIRTLEKSCSMMRSEYGLQMRNNKVTPVYSKHTAVSRVEGAWISNYISTTCGEIIGDYDEVVKDAAFGKTSAEEMRAAVCQRGKNKTTGGEDDANGLGVCPDDVDWQRVNTHEDGWSSTGVTHEREDEEEEVEVDEEQEL